MLHPKYQAILTTLSTTNTPLTGREIYEHLEPAEQGLFSGVDDLNKTINYLRDKKKFVENGESNYTNGKATLTWKISDTGFNALSEAYMQEGAPVETETVIDVELEPKEMIKQALTLIAQSVEAMETGKPIEFKGQKIDVLKRLSVMMSEDISLMLGAIVADLEALPG